MLKRACVPSGDQPYSDCRYVLEFHLLLHPRIEDRDTADMTALQQALQVLTELMRQTGVGALPLQAPDLSNPPTEDQLIVETTKSVQVLYDRYKRMQESAGVVASLLNVTEQPTRR